MAFITTKHNNNHFYYWKFKKKFEILICTNEKFVSRFYAKLENLQRGTQSVQQFRILSVLQLYKSFTATHFYKIPLK